MSAARVAGYAAARLWAYARDFVVGIGAMVVFAFCLVLVGIGLLILLRIALWALEVL